MAGGLRCWRPGCPGIRAAWQPLLDRALAGMPSIHYSQVKMSVLEKTDSQTTSGLPGALRPGGLKEEYTSRRDERRAEFERWSRLENRVADGRLVCFALGLILALLAVRWGWPDPRWLAVPAIAFVGLVVVHEPIRRRSRRAARAIEFYDWGLARLEDRWAGMGNDGLAYLDLDHRYAADLDLFGRGSLFERLCTARTRSGEQTLASWLLAPAEPAVVRQRHTAIEELKPRLDLREDLELLGSEVRAGVNPVELQRWGETEPLFRGIGTRAGAALLSALGSLAVIGWAFLDTGILPLLLIIGVEATFAGLLTSRVRRVLETVDERSQELAHLAAMIDRLERESLDSSIARRLRDTLATSGQPASAQIRRLSRLLHLLDTRKNQFFAPVAALLLWKTQLAMAIDAWRARHGPSIGVWLRTAGEFEALCALAAYAAENPEDTFPEIVAGGGRFEAEDLGHPLIPRRECVVNDVAIGEMVRVWVVSGSNMSGKSTLLRAVGVAAVLAQAGAPVRARRMRLSPLAVGATLRVQDSLQAGRSRFFAEITRVRQLVDLSSGPLPLLFLFDELFHGTNSRDRRIGAEAVLRGLLARGAIGLVTTHDLALTEIVERLAPFASNVHFEDHFENGRMHFDYRIRPGVVSHSNALALMRAVGLDIDGTSPEPEAPVNSQREESEHNG